MSDPVSPTIVLSVGPKWVSLILAGQKTVELRRRAPKSDKLSSVLIYATKPICALVAVGEVDGILRDSPEALWREIGPSSGCTKDEFFDYFEGTNIGAAMMLAKVKPIRANDKLGSA
jgi:predicted transcriptional regulator